MKYLVLLFAFWGSAAVAACPDPTLPAPHYGATGADLIVPQAWPVAAGGTQDAPCPDWVERGIITGELGGVLPLGPTAVFDLSGMAPHILMVIAQADCGAVLAVRSGDGQWFFGEERNARQEAVLWGAPDGPLQVWVGTSGEAGCDATVTLETFDR